MNLESKETADVTDSAAVQEGYKIELPNFQGPLDLLLFLIKKEEIDIYDIPIAQITRQYLETIEIMRELDLEVAGEFILMAATLIQIKVRMLLPKETSDVDEIEDDPRAELVRQLLEYRRFKEVAESLNDIEDRQRRIFPRADFLWTRQYAKVEESSDEEYMQDVNLFDLLTAFKTVLENAPKKMHHQVGVVGVTIDDQIGFLKGKLAESERLAFSELISGMEHRVRMVVTFMAILELIKRHAIRVQQASVFGEIWIVRRD